MRITRVLALLFAVVMVACSDSTLGETASRQADSAPPEGLIAFDRVLPGELAGELHWMRTDGTGVSDLNVGLWAEANPAWSPDGSRIAFDGIQVEGDEASNIFYMDVETGEITQVTDRGNNVLPSWSPDGQRIAFGRGAFSAESRWGLMEIYVTNADGSGEVALTDNHVVDASPDWSPDGGTILFDSRRSGRGDIWRMDPDGSDLVQLTDTPATELSPVWSPTGDAIAFLRGTDVEAGTDLYVMAADGSDVRPVVEGALNIGVVTWSPDGRWIAFAGRENELTGIYLVRPDGTGLRRLSDGNYQAFSPAWQPDPTQ